jgi:hypothetical protein
MRPELVEESIAKVEGSAHLAAITVRYVMKSDREMPHDSFPLLLSFSGAALPTHSEFPSFSFPPPRKSLKNTLAALEKSFLFASIAISLTWRNGEGKRDFVVVN